jgi:hypothetical protein
MLKAGVMVFNAIFNNISVILWRSVPVENHRPFASHWQTLSWCCFEYTSTWAWFELTTLVGIGTDCTGSYKSNYRVHLVLRETCASFWRLLVTFLIVATGSQRWPTTDWLCCDCVGVRLEVPCPFLVLLPYISVFKQFDQFNCWFEVDLRSLKNVRLSSPQCWFCLINPWYGNFYVSQCPHGQIRWMNFIKIIC